MTPRSATDVQGAIYTGGPILTLDPTRPSAEAVATCGEEIVAVGSEEECLRALSPGSGGGNVTRLDLAGRALLPGFIDPGIHPLAMCFTAHCVDLGRTTCIEDVLDAIGDRAHTTSVGDWIVAVRLGSDQLAERRPPTATELDRVAGGHPVVLIGRDGHHAVGNTVALKAAGIHTGRADPPGGTFERDQHSRLTGECRETAALVLLSSVPIPDGEEMRSILRDVLADLATRGFTSIGLVLQTDGEGPGGPAFELESRFMMYLADEVPFGCHTILCGEPCRAIEARRSSSLHVPSKNRWVGGVKVYLDGTLAARSALLREPYADAPDQRGFLTRAPSTIAARMEEIHLAGLQICIHAAGDAATDLTLDLFDELLKRHPVGSQEATHRIEHGTLLDAAAAERCAEMGIAAVPRLTSLPEQAGWLRERLGGERARRTYPLRTLLDARVLTASCSDAPVEAPDALAGITAAVTRSGLGTDEAVDVTEAIALFTRDAAATQQRGQLTGSIATGRRADLVVLSDDPTSVPAERIAEIEVCRTVVGGQVLHDRDVVAAGGATPP